MRNPRDFFKPLAIGAPAPLTEIPLRPSRMIHFLDFSNEKMVAKAADIATKTDILLGNLEDAIPIDRKEAAREGLIRVGREMDLGSTALWTRVNALESPWMLDDITQLVSAIGDRLEVVMVPKVEGPWDIHYVDRLLAQLEAKAGLERPILIHAILETSLGVTNLEDIATASPRMQGMSFGPADLAASRRMKTTRVGGGHPGYRVIEDPDADAPDAPRASAQQDPWHYSIARMVDACTAAGILPFYGPYGDIKDVVGCETQFRAAFLLGNLEDAIPIDRKEAALEGLLRVGREIELGSTALWTRVNALESPWVLDDLTELVAEIGNKLDVIMVPKVEGPWDIHYVDRLLAQLEAKHGIDKPILIHAILETGQGVVNLEEIATASPRMQGMSFGPADLAASRRMKTTRVGGGHPGYRVIEDPDAENPEAFRPSAQQDPWHYSIARMVDACTSAG
ncbi:MAG TPA: aldolase/citrate lyase family protein, partial [Solirubrobacteraceae bacterium]